MKRIVFFVLIIQVLFGKVCAQGKYGNYWVFAQYLGLNFNNTSLPSADTSKIIGPLLPTASICDQQGNLSCYVGTWKWADFDLRLFNKYHSLVIGGDQLFQQSGGQYLQYSGNTALLNFGNSVDTILFLQYAANHISGFQDLYFSLIDTKANGDTGIIFSLNNKVRSVKGVVGSLGCIRHANGRDWWILIHGYPNNKFYKFIASPYQVEFVSEQSIGTKFGILDTSFSNNEAFGEISMSSNGEQIVVSNMAGLIESYKFDRCSGLLYNSVILQNFNVPNNSVISTETSNISPNGRFVYGLTFKMQPPGPWPTSSNLGQMIQYDLQSSNPDFDTSVVYAFRDIDSHIDQLEYGPDGRMWFTGRSDSSLSGNLQYPQDSYMHFIEYPDVKGTACNVKINQVYMNGRRALAGLPNMPNYNLGPIDGSICDTLGLDAVSIEPMVSTTKQIPLIYPNPSGSQGAVLIIPHLIENTRVHIYDASGKLVWEHACETDKLSLPTQLSPGLYRVVVTGMEGVSWRVE